MDEGLVEAVELQREAALADLVAADDHPEPTVRDVFGVAELVYLDDDPEWIADALATLLDQAVDAYADREVSGTKMEALWELREIARGLVQAARDVQQRIEARMAAILGPAGEARLGDYQVKVRRDVRVKVADPAGLLNELLKEYGLTLDQVAAGFRMEPRLTGLRAIAQECDLDPDHFLDTYCERIEGDERLQTVPLDKAPKRVREMEHGEIRGGLE